VTRTNHGFTLIELLIVIAILAIVSVGIGSSFVTSLKSGRDARRKSDLNNIQKALEFYYEDVKAYPAAITAGSPICHPLGCATRNYMQVVPADPVPSYTYRYLPNAPTMTYQLYSCIENLNDTGPGVKAAGYAATNCGCSGTTTCKYGISSTNTTP
jgi:general secretion pathway protein G